MTLILSRSEITELLDMSEVIDVVERAHAALATADAVHPARSNVELPGSSSLLVPMVAGVGPQSVAGIKLLADAPDNHARSLPVQQSTIMLVDYHTGTCEAILDGGAITGVRTAATSAIATRHLANPAGGTLGLIGAGRLARTHLEAISQVRPVDGVVVWSRSEATAAGLASFARSTGHQVRIVRSAADVFASADIVCTLTPSRLPVVKGDWLRPGQHVNVVGAPPRPDHREVDGEAMRRSRVVVDSRTTAAAESGDLVLAIQDGAVDRTEILPELGEVIAGLRAGRRAEDEVTLFNSVGLGLQDVATAGHVLDNARTKGMGIEVALAR